MDNRNNAIVNPDARKISDAQMRCLAKCIATFGIGLYIYAGEDLPEEDGPVKPQATKPQPAIPNIKVNVSPKKLEGQRGEFQIVAPAAPEGDKKEWLNLIKTSSHMLLGLCSSDADVMTIFKKNKVIFDAVKAADPIFFTEMMVKFTETRNMFPKE
jgi:hypothetical protein